MKKICFFDTKPYDRIYFDEFAEKYGFEMVYCESKLRKKKSSQIFHTPFKLNTCNNF